LGRYYTRKKGSLYIYVTDGDEMIDPEAFPEELNLFGAESAWRLNNWMAISMGLPEEALDEAERILKMSGFREKDLDEEVLEEYFRSGDERLVEEGLTARLRERLPRLFKREEKPPEKVIMPETKPSRGPLEPLVIPGGTGEVPPPPRPLKAQRPLDEGEVIEHLLAYVRSRGFTYPDWLVKDYYLCLKTKPFVVLTGFSGLGKTALTRLVAEALTGGREDRYLRVPVQPDWLDDRRVLGFYNPITERYVSTPFLDFLLEASENPGEPFFLCLDEMNLSRVEHYLSQILSAMESLDREIHLHSIKGGVRSEDGRLIPPRVRLPENLFITGTINVDEASYPLSPKLLDRTNIIEFSEVDLEERYEEQRYERRITLDMETLRGFRRRLSPEIEEKVVEVLAEINEITMKGGFPVSYRVREEVLAYIGNSQGVFSRNLRENLRMALDLQIKQRILTKIRGTEAIRPLLERLRRFLGEKLPLSAEKVERMMERLDEDGFTSF